MEDIKMANTKAAYAHLKPELDAAFNAVMESMQLKNGAQVSSFATKLEEYLQVRHAIPCANGAFALQLALKVLRLPEGVEVVLPAFNYTSAAEVVEALGLKPIFADVLPDTFTLNPASVEKVITPATSAIIPVHLFGQCALMNPFMELAQEFELFVVEDTTQSLGAMYAEPGKQAIKAGSKGHIGVTSFFPTKPLPDAGEGAALFTNDAILAERIKLFLQPEIAGGGSSDAGLDTLLAAMLEVKIKILDAFNSKREGVAQFYDDAFADTELVQAPIRALYSSHVYQQYTIRVAPELRDGLQEYLRNNYIPSVVYYPQPLHLQQRFASLNYKPGDFPVSEKLSQSVLSLPMHTELKQDQLEYICHHVLNFVHRHA
ncbi:DegT/DnrJ/EryC1/StrS family aminotransferase [Pontibacter diazotrophicus]|uniref:DegT/DnrJ/EryC1/StrS family aminotransferase n=1 Tax=Pontibacter diazotrophicus TaxID=1400979 RepID=A0A3D8LHX0_9BACT|nr:DegT/DnrJ/EryC1/StrS family aminotransferase [Pontibacter diazotrophicus]RDV16482.1 DegT/DnrJ/EryC1/StrS family aminotransferase [Pontibacter diazotrophicus]